MEVVDLIAVAVRSWCAMRSGGGRYGGRMGNGDGVGPLSRSAYTKSHSYLFVNNLHRAHKNTGRGGGGGGRGRKVAFAGVADLEKGVRS